MDNITTTAAPLPPDIKPAPDALFGGQKIDSKYDPHSLWRMITDIGVKFFELPVMEQIQRRPYHLVRLRGSFNLAKLVRDHQTRLFRSESSQTPKQKMHVERLMFSMGEDVFIVYGELELMVYAPTTQAAAEAAAYLKKYRKLQRKKPGYRLISLSGGQPSTHLVAVKQAAPVNDEELALHYGPDFTAWERAWIDLLRQRRSGVSILYGPPGCGKTSYLRSLMTRLIRTFEFYYIPVSAFDVLSSPNFVSFWTEENGDGRGKHRIAILEDAEELLLPRDQGSQTKVANLLNIGDGFLGEHLNLHVIATTNSPVRQLDPALLRPGRLMGTREFRRLNREEATRLAKAKGLEVPDQRDYSLAELYCARSETIRVGHQETIGFV